MMEPIKKPILKFSALGIIAGVLLVAGACTVAGCSGGSGGGEAVATPTPSPTPDTSGLPPDPGAAGKATLAGIDSDGDGVRDDIQRYIALTYPNSAKTRAALTQAAKVYQTAILDANDKAKSMQHADENSRATECLAYLQSNDFVDMGRTMESKVANTEERTRAYLKYNDQLGGEVFSLRSPTEWKSSCTFNPDSLSN